MAKPRVVLGAHASGIGRDGDSRDTRFPHRNSRLAESLSTDPAAYTQRTEYSAPVGDWMEEAVMISSKLRPKRPSLGTVLGFTALVVAVVGTAHAAQTHVIVRRGDIAPGAVTAKALAKGAVHPKALAKGAVHAKAIAGGAVHSRALANGSVNARALRRESVGTAALARDAVTAAQLAPGSVYGGALGGETVVTKPIADLDKVAENGEWTASNAETVLCGAGEALLGVGFGFTNPGNREAAWLQAMPFVNGLNKGVTGWITTNSGGSASAEVAALCLK